jgi:hypothetical protein
MRGIVNQYCAQSINAVLSNPDLDETTFFLLLCIGWNSSIGWLHDNIVTSNSSVVLLLLHSFQQMAHIAVIPSHHKLWSGDSIGLSEWRSGKIDRLTPVWFLVGPIPHVVEKVTLFDSDLRPSDLRGAIALVPSRSCPIVPVKKNFF